MKHSWVINDNENKQNLTFIINLPEMDDDKEAIAEVRVSSESFGDSKWLNGTGVKERFGH